MTCRCLDCGQEFYADEPQEGIPDEVLHHNDIVDNEAELHEAEEELKRQIEKDNDRRFG